MTQTIDIIDPKTAGTIPGMFLERVRRTPQACAYRHYDPGNRGYVTINWEEVCALAARWQAAFQCDGIHAGDRVAVILKNCPEWALFDLAAMGLGLVTVPLYADDRPANIRHILRETGARLVLVENADRWLEVEKAGDRLQEIERVVTLEPLHALNSGNHGPASGTTGEGARREETGSGMPITALADWLKAGDTAYASPSVTFASRAAEPPDLATIVYTSGTTGTPKGVMLSHANILENAAACLKRIAVYREDMFLSFLPLSHTFERTVGYYIPMMAGAAVTYVRSIDRLAEDLLEVRPTILISVPRIYERVHAKIEAKLAIKPVFARALFRLTVHTGWRRFLRLQKRGGWNPLFILWPILKKLVAKRLMDAFGGRVRLSISGGAPIAPSIARTFIGLGLNFLQGYGLTETSPVISVNSEADNDPATVGKPLPGVEARIAADGELLVRGPNVMRGYWRNRDATEEAIDGEGFFHTGDIAAADAGGRLKIVGRIKDILVLSTGEKIPPGDLELAIAANPLFEQVMIVGEGKPYLAALVVLNEARWKALAAGRGAPPDPRDILDDGTAERILLEEIGRMIARFPGYAQVRRIHASLRPWRRRDGLITNTLKLRRNALLRRFRTEVDSLYKGH